jgi:hypothetical protein
MDAESQLLADKDAEIERLKAENKKDMEVMIAMGITIEGKNQLITELCDALEWYVPFSLTPRDWDLLDRAREATK